MQALALYVRFIDGLNDLIGRAVSWLIVGCVVVCASVALLRYGIGFGLIWMQEIYVVFFAIVFMGGAGWVYMKDQHVRVDIFSARWSPKRRAAMEIVGTLVFLLPWMGFVFWSAWPYVASSWAVWEPSSQAGGLPGVYLQKSLILAFAALLGAQGLASIARGAIIIAGRDDLLPPPAPAAGH